jgi:rubrerythrin
MIPGGGNGYIAADMIVFAGGQMTMDQHLRFALRTALLVEKQSCDFYQYAAKMVRNDKTRLVFELLAGDEAYHMQIFKKFYEELGFDGLQKLINQPPDLDTPVYRALLESVGNNTQEKEALEISLREEEACIELYSDLIRGFKDPGLCKLFEQALSETRTHCKIIHEEYLRVMAMAHEQPGSRVINLRREDFSSAPRLTGNRRPLLTGPEEIDE